MTELNKTTETTDARRLALVAAAQRQWIDALTDLGGRNTLLYFKDSRAGTLDLACADPDATERFEKAGSTRLTPSVPAAHRASAPPSAILTSSAPPAPPQHLQHLLTLPAPVLPQSLPARKSLPVSPAPSDQPPP